MNGRLVKVGPLKNLLRRFLWSMIMSIGVAAYEGEAQDFEVNGIFNSELFSQEYQNGQEPCRIEEGEFSVAVQGCNSQLRYKVNSTIAHLEKFKSEKLEALLSCDGTNFCLLVAIDAFGKALPTGRMSTGSVPERSDEKLGTLWLAFASHCYFKNASNLIYSPYMNSPSLSDWTDDHRVCAEWSRLEGFPRLPLSVVHTAQFVDEVPCESVVSNVVYSVNETTTCGEATLPKRFEYRNFFPPGRLISRFSGEVTAVQAKVSKRLVPPVLAGKTFIIDERFIEASGNPIARYVHTSSNWPTLKEGKEVLTGQRPPSDPAQEKLQQRSSYLSRRVAVIAIFLLTTVAIALVVRKSVKTNQDKTYEKH